MSRSIITVAVAGMLWFGAATTRADIISRNNPYRSFNISGINYGSMQWERQHKAQQSRSTPYSTSPYSSSGRRFLLWRR